MALSKMKINKMRFFQDNDNNMTDNEFDNKHEKNGTSMALQIMSFIYILSYNKILAIFNFLCSSY